MAEFKLVISDPKSGLSAQKQAKEQAFKAMVGLKIGDSVKGEVLGMAGYEFVITGGSDYCGFPMRRDVSGTGRKKLLAYEGVGVKRQERGMLQRKTVCGNTVHDKIAQINLKITKAGAEDMFAAALKKREESQAKRKPAEKKEVPKEEKAPEKKEELKKEEAPAKKQEGKPEAKPVSAEKKAEPAKAPAEVKKDAPTKQKEPAKKEAPTEENEPAKKEAGAKKTPEPSKKAVPAEDKKEAEPKKEEPAKAPAEQHKEAEKKQTSPSEKDAAQQEPEKK